MLASLVAPVRAQAQPSALRDTAATPRLPFPVGEVLDYRVNVAFGGNIGHGQVRVEGPVLEHRVPIWRLVSEMKARRAFVRATDRTTSWLDPTRFVAVRFVAVRFEKRERHPLSQSDALVEMDLAATAR